MIRKKNLQDDFSKTLTTHRPTAEEFYDKSQMNTNHIQTLEGMRSSHSSNNMQNSFSNLEKNDSGIISNEKIGELNKNVKRQLFNNMNSSIGIKKKDLSILHSVNKSYMNTSSELEYYADTSMSFIKTMHQNTGFDYSKKKCNTVSSNNRAL